MKIRPMQPGDLDFAMRCIQHEGWLSETRFDFENFLAYDPNGCFLAELKAQPIGICVATRYRRNGFIGELIVIEAMRGRGFGRRLLEHAIQYLHASGVKNILLDGDLGAIGLYEKVGFRKVCQSLRFLGEVQGKPHSLAQPFRAEDAEPIYRLDRRVLGENRHFFLARRLHHFPNLCRVVVQNDKIQGYIMGRPGNKVISIGPWIALAECADPAEMLASLASECGGEKLRISVLETNQNALKVIQSFPEFRPTEPCWRMVLGPSAQFGMNDQILAIGSPAKG